VRAILMSPVFFFIFAVTIELFRWFRCQLWQAGIILGNKRENPEASQK